MADEDNDYVGGMRHRIKDAIDMGKLRETGSCTFELEDVDDPLNLEDDEEDRKADLEAKKGFFEGISLKNLDVVHCSAEEALTDFDEVEKSWSSISEGVQKKVCRPGRGDKVPDRAKVWIHYMAYHEGSDEPFDNSVKVSRPFAFRMGEGRVIQGLEIGVASMEIKEISKFLIQPAYAFGPLGCKPRVPENSRVLFTVELLDYKIVAKCSGIFDMTVEERAELPFSEVYKAAEELKFDAKSEYINTEYQEAANMYSKAARMLEEYFATTESQEAEKNTLLYTLFNNLANCYLKLDKPKKAVKASKSAMNLPVDVTKEKAYYLFCKANFELGNIEEAKRMGDEALLICPNHNEILKLYSNVLKKLQKDNLDQKNLYKKMMAKK